MRAAPTVFQRRIVIGAVIAVAAFSLVGLRLVDVTLLGRHDNRPYRAHTITPRADLIDRNGELLARDLPVKDLYAQPRYFWNKTQAADALARATGGDARRLLFAFTHHSHSYVLVARQLPPDVQDRVGHLGLPGLEFETSAKRYYPDGRIAAQVLGVTDPDNNGVSGLELGLQKRLRKSTPVATSLDMRVQFILANQLAEARKTFQAVLAGGIVMNVDTGEVLAMVSLPDFDPNTRVLAKGDSMRNAMAQDVFELGSVFKIFSFSMALQDRTITPDTVFSIPPGYKVGRYTIHDAERLPPQMAARDILAQSSNVGTAQIVLRSGGARQKAFLTSLGLLQPIQTQLPETARPLYPVNWGDIETATIGFGQGISVSPLSFVAAAASIVNGGRHITPTFLKHTQDARGAQVIAPQTSEEMRNLLRYVVTNGTGKSADIPGYDVGGKTGSAQIPGPHGGYAHGKILTSFCAVFPISSPRYLVFVLLDNPHGTKETHGFALSGYTAAPLAGRVIARIAPILNVPRVLPPPPAKIAGSNS
jgi:cell division protein FtsI (penicillin-binding protein 3)